MTTEPKAPFITAAEQAAPLAAKINPASPASLPPRPDQQQTIVPKLGLFGR